MASDFDQWPTAELRSVANNSSRPFSYSGRDAVVFINTGDVLNGKFLHATSSSPDVLPGQAKKAIKKDDILFSEIRPANGRYAFVDRALDSYVVSTKFMVITATNGVLPRFLYLVLTSSQAMQEFQRIAEGRSGTFPQITFESIGRFPVPIPPAFIQQRLVEFFQAIDDKLQQLAATNETLELLARAIFKSWFVDFDPVRAKSEGREPEGIDPATAALFPSEFQESTLGEIPKDWTVCFIGECAEIVGGSTPSTTDSAFWEDGIHCWATPKDLSRNKAAVLLDTERKITSLGLAGISSGLLPIGTVLMSSRAPIGYISLAQVPTAINQGFIAMKPLGEMFNLFLLLWTEYAMDTIKSLANGSTFQEISKKNFRTIRLVRPDRETLSAFVSIVQPQYERITVNAKLIQTLTELRDTLVPRLISGRLRIPDAEKLLEAVL